jgi:hypothetical protein
LVHAAPSRASLASPTEERVHVEVVHVAAREPLERGDEVFVEVRPQHLLSGRVEQPHARPLLGEQ